MPDHATLLCQTYTYMCVLQNDDFNQIGKAVQVIERMVNQNTFDDVSQGIICRNLSASLLSARLHLSVEIDILVSLFSAIVM